MNARPILSQPHPTREQKAKVAQSAGALSQLAGKGDYDIRSLISEAAIAAVNARRQGRSLKEYAKTQDFTVDPDVVAIIDFFADNIRSAKRIGEGLSKLANAFLRQVEILEQNTQQAGLFGEQPVRSREQLLEDFKRDTRQQATIQQQDRGEHTGQNATRSASGREGTAISERPENQERQRQAERRQEVSQAPSNDGVFFGKFDGTAYKKEGEAKLAQKNRRDLKGKNTRVVKRDNGWWIQEVAPAESTTNVKQADNKPTNLP